MGINEFAGYLSVGLVAFLTSWVANTWGLRPYPFYIGIVLAFAGLLGSIFLIKDTQQFLAAEEKGNTKQRLKNLFWQTSILHPNLGSVSQAGLVNNLNDGMVWGLLPLFLMAKNFGLNDIGIIVGVYPAVWGIGQLFTGKMGDHFCKKDLLFWGMFLQGIALLGIIFFNSFAWIVLAAALLGWGTAMVYPNFISAIADGTHPAQRAESIGVFRMWRDLGYAVGAILTGLIADWFGMTEALLVIVGLTFLSAAVVQIRMYCEIDGRKRLSITSFLRG